MSVPDTATHRTLRLAYLAGALRRYTLTHGEHVIGRHPSCDVRIPGKNVSKRHARITVSEDATTLVDLDSKNGVYVNGGRIREHALQEGDILRIGSTEIAVTGPRDAGRGEAEEDAAQERPGWLSRLFRSLFRRGGSEETSTASTDITEHVE